MDDELRDLSQRMVEAQREDARQAARPIWRAIILSTALGAVATILAVLFFRAVLRAAEAERLRIERKFEQLIADGCEADRTRTQVDVDVLNRMTAPRILAPGSPPQAVRNQEFLNAENAKFRAEELDKIRARRCADIREGKVPEAVPVLVPEPELVQAPGGERLVVGLTGAQGQQGVKGDKGDKGDQGNPGESIVGPRGPEGEPGQPGGLLIRPEPTPEPTPTPPPLLPPIDPVPGPQPDPSPSEPLSTPTPSPAGLCVLGICPLPVP